MQLKLLSAGLLVMVISGCGGGGSSDTTTAISSVSSTSSTSVTPTSVSPTTSTITDDPPPITITPPAPSNYVMISGKITYDLVPVDSDNIGLDYNNIVREAAKGIQVVALDSSNQNIATTLTDDLGEYTLALPPDIQIKLRVYARLVSAPGTSSWDISVIDNTNGDAYYVMDGSLASTGVSDSSRFLHAPSGWDGSSYTSSRVAAPFAILDNAYNSIQKVLTANPDTVFPPLLVNWSTDNVSSVNYDPASGQIITSHYTNSNLFILGDADSDTDEYDDHVVTHEWGHYYEDKLSRSDSIGGSHGSGDILDIRVAFSEGFGNAFSGMVLDEPVYFDTMGASQASGFSFDMESEVANNPGWYSEASVHRILYDLYDDNSDGSDILSFGFTPLHSIFTGTQKNTPAFTSIFSFITLLKDANAGDTDDIDTLVSDENITTITDVYGLGRVDKVSEYPYKNLIVGIALPIVITNEYGEYNKLSNRKYIKFNISTSGTYTIKVQQTNGTDSDPDFYLFDSSPFSRVDFSENVVSGLEQKDVTLTAGEYLLDVSEYNNIASAELNVSITLK